MISQKSLPQSLASQWFGLRAQSPARQVALVVAGSLVVALSAQLSVKLPFTPVPVTGQTLGVLVVGGALGAWLGAFSLLLYLAEASVGMPFLAGGAHGLPVGPSGGYLIGFILMATVVGWLHEHGWGKSFAWSLASMVVAEIVLYAIALPWLGFYVGMSHVWALGFFPFVTGDALKLFLAGLALPTAWRLSKG